MKRKNKTGLIGIIITVIILSALIVLSNSDIKSFSNVKDILSMMVMPVQNGLTYLKNKINGNDVFFSDIDNLKKEKEKLEEENIKLQQALSEMEIIRAENKTLKEYLNLTEKYGEYKTVPGVVIAKDISNFSNVITINVGRDQGIAPKMTVIGDKGLVRSRNRSNKQNI